MTLLSDAEMQVPLRRALDAHAQNAPTFDYLFSWRAPDIGAFHAVDLPFTFGTFDADGWGAFVGVDDDARGAVTNVARRVGRVSREAALRRGRRGHRRWCSTGCPESSTIRSVPACQPSRKTRPELVGDPASMGLGGRPSTRSTSGDTKSSAPCSTASYKCTVESTSQGSMPDSSRLSCQSAPRRVESLHSESGGELVTVDGLGTGQPQRSKRLAASQHLRCDFGRCRTTDQIHAMRPGPEERAAGARAAGAGAGARTRRTTAAGSSRPSATRTRAVSIARWLPCRPESSPVIGMFESSTTASTPAASAASIALTSMLTICSASSGSTSGVRAAPRRRPAPARPGPAIADDHIVDTARVQCIDRFGAPDHGPHGTATASAAAVRLPTSLDPPMTSAFTGRILAEVAFDPGRPDDPSSRSWAWRRS